MFKRAWNFVLLIVAVLMVLVGLVTFLLPIPFGIVLLLMGIAMLMMVSPPVRRWFHAMRDRYPSLDRRLSSIEPHLPVSLQKILRPDNLG
ncbi:MAG: hypothetical protein L3J67_06990 [Hyphomicrobiaceae bacterium]|nr:hypothetical protein [Hyphomicrobiaceae bacterium]